MTYEATVRSVSGETRRQTVEAPDRAAALRLLRAHGEVLLAFGEAGGAARISRSNVFGGLRAWFTRFRPKALDVEFGLQQLASMLRSGLSLLVALRTAADQARNRRAARVWTFLADGIETGLSCHEAAEACHCFDPYVLALIRVGEQSGELDRTLVCAAEHLEQTRDMRMMLVNALIYPVLVVIMTIGVVGFMVVKVIPQIQAFLSQANQTLPAITQWLLDFSLWVRLHAVALAVGIAAVPIGVWLIRRVPAGREQTDRAMLYLPVIGPILRLFQTAVVARGLSILLDSGVTLLEGLRTVTFLIRNRRLARRMADARDAVIRGETLAHALAGATEFMPMLAKMAAVGESTGTLGAAFAEVARFHEIMLKSAIRRFGTLIEPILILIVGGIVGFVYTAFFLALFSIATTA